MIRDFKLLLLGSCCLAVTACAAPNREPDLSNIKSNVDQTREGDFGDFLYNLVEAEDKAREASDIKASLDAGDAWLPRAHTRPAEITRVREWLSEQGRDGVPFTVFAADTDEGRLAGFAEAGVDEITLTLDTLPEADTLRSLDALAAVAAAHH